MGGGGPGCKPPGAGGGGLGELVAVLFSDLGGGLGGGVAAEVLA